VMCREVGSLMAERGAGAIVNIASIVSLTSAPVHGYGPAKAAVANLTMTLAAEWGGRGVRVNAVCPGWVKTEMDERDMGSGAYTDADITSRVPMGRFATPDDIARVIAFLADPRESAFINGHALSVDGGWFADGSWDSMRLRKRQTGMRAASR
jgi:NAD(P)-dependent dehydrogenase (short-subunit alcohol dehydrogenase family)